MINSAYTHNGDRDLMLSLGLRTSGFKREWTDIGTVVLHDIDTDNEYHALTGAKPATTIKVEVKALPAQFWRFTIARPRDEIMDDPNAPNGFRAVYEPIETIVMRTGSGGFRDYWETAKGIAEHMIDVEVVTASKDQKSERGEA